MLKAGWFLPSAWIQRVTFLALILSLDGFLVSWLLSWRREVILSHIWETEDDYFASRSLDVYVNKLRKLFANDASIQVKTVRGIGIMMVLSLDWFGMSVTDMASKFTLKSALSIILCNCRIQDSEMSSVSFFIPLKLMLTV